MEERTEEGSEEGEREGTGMPRDDKQTAQQLGYTSTTSPHPGFGRDACCPVYHVFPARPHSTHSLEVEVKHCLPLREQVALYQVCVGRRLVRQ